MVHTIPYHTILYHFMPYHTILYHFIPYYTILYHAMLICCSYIRNDIKLICRCCYHDEWIANFGSCMSVNTYIPPSQYNLYTIKVIKKLLTKKVSCNQVCCCSNFFLLFSSFSLQEIILSKIINKRVTACLLVWCIALRKLKFILYNGMEINKHFIVLYENTCTNLMTSTFTHYNAAPPFLLLHLLFLFFIILFFSLFSI